MNGINSRLTSAELLAIFVLSLFFVFGCSTGRQTTAPVTPGAQQAGDVIAPPIDLNPAPVKAPSGWEVMPAKPFDEALISSLASLLSLVELPAPGAKHVLLIDALIDANSGVQSHATRKIEARLADLARAKYPQFSLQPFLQTHIGKSPLILLGTLTPVNASGFAEGRREAYRICLALADLKSGKIISKEMAKAQMKGVNHTPTPYFLESPAWMPERSTEAYVQACEASKPGDRIPAAYFDNITARARVGEALTLYERGQYKQALEHYASAAARPAGDELRIQTGLYLTNLKLGRSEAAAKAFSKIVEYGIAQHRFAVNFLFKPGTAAFLADKSINTHYAAWLGEIARRASESNLCLEIIGHTSHSGSEPLNEKLSLQRAEYIRKALEAGAADMAGRIVAQGAGSRENLVGTGKDDMSDSLDRRVAFRIVPCTGTETQTAYR